MKRTTYSIVFLLLGSAASITLASGTSGGIGRTYGSQDYVDHAYEQGKAVFQGRATGVDKRRYCVDTGTEKVKLKRSSLKPFKKGTAKALALALYDCDQPDLPIYQTLSAENLPYVLYYLNKRYRLKLKDG